MKANHKIMAKPPGAVTKALRYASKPHLKLPQGYVAFRLLCHSQAGYSVIGIGGSMAVNITKSTGISVLRVEDTLPGCEERIIYIIGRSHLDRTLLLHQQHNNNGASASQHGGEIRYEVSATQEALIRVLQILESTRVAEGFLHCRLLAVKGEEKIKSLPQVDGASVRVLPLEQHPLCADLSDDLIQISGDTIAVRKALLAVTYRLQGNTSRAIKQFHSPVPSRVTHAKKLVTPNTVARDGLQSCMSSGAKKVAFRLLCSTFVAGGLIGQGGSIVKALEKETGASIDVSDTVVGETERVIMVSAMENKEWQNSPAQDATLRAFTRLIEAASESGFASGSTGGESVTARLLISCGQANLLDMKDNAGAEVRILESHSSDFASVDDKVVQIVGEYSDVHICLLQVTWTLRESIFSREKKNTPLLPHELCGRPHVNATTTMVDEMDKIKISCDMDAPLPTVLSSESSSGRILTAFMENQGDAIASSSSSELGSGDEFSVVKNEELEIIVPAHVFGHVYGEGGGNLAILRQISGATVIVHDPCPGGDGKVIICGTPNQTMAAKSMLYAFIMSRHDCMIIK